MLLHLIRHGQTTGDVEGRYGGAYDDHLTELGKRQSEALVPALRGEKPSIVYSSPLHRARATADILAAALGAPRGILAEFRECNRYGILSGMTRQEALQAHPSEVEKIPDLHQTVAGAESYLDFKKRVTDAFDALRRGRDRDPIALVTHGGVFRLLFREVLKLGDASVSDCAYVQLTLDEESFGILALHGISMRSTY